jgi:nucleotide sugar dehydrogenase
VGGACIPCYPAFLQDKAGQLGLSLHLTEIARTVNEEMPKYTVSMAVEALEKIGKDIKEVKTSILGLAFRGGVADARNSPSYELVDILEGHGTEIVVHDPLIEKNEILEEMGIPLVDSLEEAFSSASLIVIATDHEIYSELDLNEIIGLVGKPAVIIDGRNTIKTTRVPKDLIITGIGKKSLGL